MYGMFWAHTVYGGDDLDSMMQCTLDSQKVQTVGVRVQLPDGGVDFHMNVDRLGYVDRNEGERAFNLNVQAARLFVAAPELLAALEEIEMIAAKNAGPGLVDIRIIAYKAIAKAKGGE